MIQLDWTSTLTIALLESGVLVLAFWIAKPWIGRFVTKSVEHSFDTKLEDLRARQRREEQIRQSQHDKEISELDRISGFLNNQKAERSLALQNKKLEAAEALMGMCDDLQRLAIIPTMLQSIKFEAIEGRVDSQLAQLFKFLGDSTHIDQIVQEIGQNRSTLPKLYLSEKTLANFDVYQSIILHAIAVIKAGGMAMDISSLLNSDELRTKIVGVDPWTEPMFEEHGFSSAFFMHERYYQQALNALREEIHGEAQDNADIKVSGNLAINARTVHADVKAKAEEFDIDSTLINQST